MSEIYELFPTMPAWAVTVILLVLLVIVLYMGRGAAHGVLINFFKLLYSSVRIAARSTAIAEQLSYYRGFHEFFASPWLQDSNTLQRLMGEVRCLGGQTQIARVLQHVLNETRRTKVHAAIFIGDAIEEPADQLCHLAGQLGLLNVPLFIFQEGGDVSVAQVFKQMAKLSGGAHCNFDLSSRDVLAELLGAVAVYASGGHQALLNYKKKYPHIESLSKQLPAPK